MSAIAGISLKAGHIVSGSDIEENNIIKKLKKLGAKIYIGHSEKNLSLYTNLVVKSQAIKKDNPEIQKAKKLGIPIKDRSEYLGDLMASKKAIAVAGTHGKTTISSMISVILEKAGKDPTIAIGGIIPEIESNWKIGKGKFMVVEACEYRSSFLKLKPWATIISNIEEEHLDCFKNIKEIIYSFSKFLKLTSKDGFSVVNFDDINIQKILNNENFLFPLITYGTQESNALWKVKNVKEEDQKVYFEVWKNNQKIDEFLLKIPGKHNTLNALASIVVTSNLGINLGTIKNALENFKGAVRRMEVKGEKNNILVIDDYGHHPTEIKATLKALKNFYKTRRNLWCIFQPHQYSRTKLLFNDFLKAFNDADKLIINDIYKVRDSKKDVQSVNSKYLVEEINKKEKNKALYIGSFEETAKFLKKNAKPQDIILTIGAGPVYKVGELFLKNENKEE